MWLFPRVRANVHGQRTSLDETFPTVWLFAMVRALVGMNAKMALEVRFAIEALLRHDGISCGDLQGGSERELF